MSGGAGRFELSELSAILNSRRFLALDRAGLVDLADIVTWDDDLLREPRLLVPIDVQALYVPQDGAEPMVRLPMSLAGAGTDDPAGGMPEPFADGAPRDAGVHLHWAMPDALLRGRLEERPDGARNRLGLRPLPDRWVVLRILLPDGSDAPAVRGWVLEADRAVAVPLAAWGEGSAASGAAVPAGRGVEPAELTGTCGGSVAWASAYDAVLNRFAFHDPLDDLDAAAPGGVDRDAATYVVAGWWSAPAADPLDAARGERSFAELLDALRWRALGDWAGARAEQLERKSRAGLRQAIGLETAERFGAPRSRAAAPVRSPRGAAAPRAPLAQLAYAPIDATVAAEANFAGSKLAAGVHERYVTDPWHPRASLLHGSVYGVPVRGDAPVDRRPESATLRVSLGRHDDDVIGSLASVPGTPAAARADTQRLLAALTAQKLSRIGSPDGAVEVEEHRHAAGFASVPGGMAGDDRFVSGGLGGARHAGRDARRATTVEGGKRTTGANAERDEATLRFGVRRADLKVGGPSEVHAALRDPAGDDMAAAEPRVVARPASRFTFALDPLVAVQGARRSLRHGGDGRASADGKLTCRWAAQAIGEVQGVLSGRRLLPSIGSGAIPPEVVLLAREAVLHDPYHVRWLTAAASPRGQGGAIRSRLTAEAALRFGRDGVYDGETQALAESGPGFEGRWMADELHRFSLVKGADPDPVGVTTWAQPWVPLWLEWEVELTSAPDLGGWGLGTVDHQRPDAASDSAATRTLRGRALLATGAATTLRRAITDWLTAEDARDRAGAGAGEADEATETALRDLATAVGRLDVVTASLDGLRRQLLGLPAGELVRRRGEDGMERPAPVAAPTLMVGGHLRLSRARLVDAFGRLLDVPVDAVATPAEDETDGGAGRLRVRPRLTRPARWRYRLVDAAGDADAAEARVDQVDPTLTVNPVAGFLLPDHLDESLEVFDVQGRPLGELLHEAAGGGVTWEIAAGRDGPPDAGPSHGLAPAQRSLGWLAAGVVAADAARRAGGVATEESALSALLRAIDTTLWTVDTFAALGSEHVAGLVGRPIAVVRAQLRLELRPEDDLDLSDPDRAAERVAAERELAAVPFEVRIGELTRTDDGVLGLFVDDDYGRLRLVDKTVAGLATTSGRSRGQLGLLGRSEAIPPVEPIEHPYVVGDGSGDTLRVHLGQTVTLTLLMHPGGRAHLTSGVLPRKAVALARDWVAPGLAALAPSLRTGPLLVETDLDLAGEVRLPKVSVLGQDQAFHWRDTPATWRRDAILAATQSALLPDTPAAVREGWIRVVPGEPGASS